MSVSLPGAAVVGAAGTTTLFVSLEQFLRTGETLTGTPTILEVDSSDLTLADKARITTETTIPENAPFYGVSATRRVIPANKGMLFTVATVDADEALGNHDISISVATTGVTPTQTLDVKLTIEVV